ncbi:hypothetical protein X975_07676, partial [Stegodyphus mimosarum]
MIDAFGEGCANNVAFANCCLAFSKASIVCPEQGIFRLSFDFEPFKYSLSSG